MRLAAVVAGAVAGLALAEPALAAGKPTPPTPVFEAEVSLVQLPVFVYDKEGRAVPGLRAEDFELTDDGRPARVVSFMYVDTTSEEGQEEVRRAPATRRHFLFLFDLSFTDAGGLSRARQAARDMLRKLVASDLAAVATFDVARGLRLVANFSEDRALAAHAIETLGVPTLTRIEDPLGLALALGATEAVRSVSNRAGEDVNPATDLFIAAMAGRLRRAEEQTYRAQVLGLLDGLDLLGRSLRSVEGRKQLLYFSAGFDAQTLVGTKSTAELMQEAEAVVQGRIYDVDTQRRFGDDEVRGGLSRMARTLSRADAVIHAVDVTGLGGGVDATRTTVRTDPNRDTRGRDALHFMAAETGGRLLKDTNDLGAALAEILDMTSRYYILGYQPDDLRGAGRFHKLKVKARRPGARVSHRAGYHERERGVAPTALQRKFEAAQLVMTGTGDNEMRFAALCLPFPAPGPRQALGLVVQVPREQLRWQGAPLGLEVYGYAVDRQGAVAAHLARFARLDTSVADVQGRARGVTVLGELSVPPGEYTLRLMVTERESGLSGSQFLDVSVPEYDPRLGFLLPPVVLEKADEWVSLDLADADDQPSLFSIGGQSLLPRATFGVEKDRPQKLMVIAYPPARPGDPAAAMEITSVLRDAAGQVVAGGSLRIEGVYRDKAVPRRGYLLDYTPEGVVPGDYKLTVAVGEEGKARLESYSLLRVLADGPGR